jgi:prephenate dehydratase/chorismate mutase
MLEKIRKKIDAIDTEILKLLSERMELSLMTGKFKEKIADAGREKIVLQKAEKNNVLLGNDFSKKVFEEILARSKELQKQKIPLMGFQGEHGAYSEEAANSFCKNNVTIPCGTFSEVFEGVENGQFDKGIVPVENSLEGAVTQVNDLLIQNDLKIVSELKLPIHHCLLTLPETDYRDIKVVYSHPQALAQCRGFIERNKLQARPFYDTAGAARMLSSEQREATAVIASRMCANLYGLEVLKENIEDENTNTTRFVVISKNGSGEKGSKCAIAFSTKHRAGALFEVLKIFSDAKINLTRIESRPIQKDPGNYAFLLDFQGSATDLKIKKVLEAVEHEAVNYKFLGCFMEAKK